MVSDEEQDAYQEKRQHKPQRAGSDGDAMVENADELHDKKIQT